jgi:hypothetical protein
LVVCVRKVSGGGVNNKCPMGALSHVPRSWSIQSLQKGRAFAGGKLSIFLRLSPPFSSVAGRFPWGFSEGVGRNTP